MRIGVDATCWANSRGYGRFTRELVPVMAALAPNDRFICFVDERANEQFHLDLPNVERRIVRLDQSPTTAAGADGNRSPLDMLRLTWAVAKERLDVFFCPSVYTYFPLPPWVRAVVTVHDAIAERFPDLTLPGRRARLFWRLKVLMALWQTRLVLTVSDFAAQEIARELHVNPDRIRVALEAPASVYKVVPAPGAADRTCAKLGLPGDRRWLVYVGGFNPHKNIDQLVRAHAALVRERPADAPHLVLVGPTGTDVFHSDQAGIRRLIAEEGTAEFVHWLGFLPDEDLRHVHAGALALVLPSACEGFGLPAVEAAACATPVIATTESPLPQLLAGGGLFVTPRDLNGLIAAIRRLMRNEPERLAMGHRAREHALELTWERGARAALAALNEVVA